MTDGTACTNRRQAEHRPRPALPHCDVQKKSMLSKNSEFEHGLLGNYESTFVKVEGYTVFEYIVVLIIY